MSLALLGVMLLFVAALLGAERRELHAWRTRWLQDVTTLTASSSTATNPSNSSSVDASLEALDVQCTATHGFGRAVSVASIGVALAACALVLRRGSWWFVAVALALACLIVSTRQFTVTRAQLSEAAGLRASDSWPE